MAKLITCKDCGHQVSKNAKQCPNCGGKIKHNSPILNIIIGIILISLVWAMAKSCSGEQPANNTAAQNVVASNPGSNNVASKEPVADQPIATANWEYNSDTDKMRGTTTNFADNPSLNSANFQFPYNGESHLHILLRHSSDGNDVIFTIDKGQFHCKYDGCEISVKFDNEPIKSYSVGEADSGKTDVLFLSTGEAAFINKLKKSKKVMIEAPFFNEGRQQFEFNTIGLDWKY